MILLERQLGDLQVAGRQPVGVELLGDDVLLGDQRLFFLAVAGKLKHFHPVQQGRGDRLQHVGRGDEHDLGQVEIDVEVMVAEGRVLLGVEDLQERGRGVAAEVGAELVDLVEHEDRVVRRGLANALDDPAGHGGHVGAAMAADLGLVVHAAQADPDELSPQRPGDALAQRRLARSRRAGEAEDRSLHVLLELAHGQVLEDSFLDLLEVVVVVVEDLPRPAQVEPVAARLAPGKDRQPVEIGADDRVLGRAGVHAGQPLELALGLVQHFLRRTRRLDPLPELGDLGILGLALTQLLLDRLDLLPQEVIALGLRELASRPAPESWSRAPGRRAGATDTVPAAPAGSAR